MNSANETIKIKPYSVKELAAIYTVAPRTIRIWLEKHQEAIGEKIGRFYTALQVKLIFKKLGLPGIAADDMD